MDSEPKALFGSWEVELSTPQQGTILTLLTCLVDDVWRAQQANPFWQSTDHCNGVSGAPAKVTYRCEVGLHNQTGQPARQRKVVGALQFHPATLRWQEHLADPQVALREMARVLRPGAPVVVVITRQGWLGFYVRRKWGVTCVTASQACAWLRQAGFERVQFVPIPNPLLPCAWSSLACIGFKPRS